MEKPINVFEPLPWQIPVWKDKTRFLILSSGAGTGKSRIAAEKLHGFLLRYPKSTGLVVRKTRSSMSNSTLLFLQETVIGKDSRVIHRPSLYRFEYSNGSILAYGGMLDESQRESIRSIGINGAVDIIWAEEANKFTREDINELIARLRGTAAGWNQLILTTNPDSTAHHLYTDFIIPARSGTNPYIKYYYATVYDNPYNSEDYIKGSLESLTGVQRKRLLDGQWVQAGGVVFDNWLDDYEDGSSEPSGNVREEANYIPGGGEVVWFVDDGYTGEIKNGAFTAKSHPRAIIFAQLRPDGTIALFNESLEIKKLATVHIKECLDWSQSHGIPFPSYVVCDKAAASLHLSFKEAKIPVRMNAPKVEESIKVLNEYISSDMNGYRRIICAPTCKHIISEFSAFSRDSVTNKIIKAHDHTIDAIRYGVWDIEVGEFYSVDVANYENVGDLDSLNYEYFTDNDSPGIDIGYYYSKDE